MKYIFAQIALGALIVSAYAQEPAPAQPTNRAEWVEVKNEAGIKVFSREIPNSKLRECKVVTIVDAPLEDVEYLVRHAENNHKWIHSYKYSKVLEQKDTTDYVIYSEINSPFLASDRDLVMKMHFARTENSFSASMAAAPGFAPEKQGIVRVPVLDGYWAAAREGKKQTKITYKIMVDPGGNVGDVMANNSLVDASFKTFYNMQQYFAHPELQADQEQHSKKRRRKGKG